MSHLGSWSCGRTCIGFGDWAQEAWRVINSVTAFLKESINK